MAAEPLTDACQARVRAQPDDAESYRCFFVAARRDQLWAESIAGLESLIATDPDNGWALLYLGRIEADRGRARAAALMERSIESFANREDADGEVRARLALASYLSGIARYDEQWQQIEQSVERAQSVNDEELLVSALLARASYFSWSRRLREAEAVFDELLPPLETLNPLLRAEAHSAIAQNHWFGGRLDQAANHYRKAAALFRNNGDRYREASELFNTQLTVSKLPGLYEGQLMEMAQATLEAAVAGGNRHIEARTLIGIGQIPDNSLDERIGAVERALEIHRSMERYASACLAVRLLARLTSERNPDDYKEGLRLLDEAIEMARAIGSKEDEARALIVRSGAQW